MGEAADANQAYALKGMQHGEKTAAHFPVGPAMLALLLASYFFLVEANVQFALFLSVIAILVFEWEQKPPKGN
jgi:hypothetical protein